MGLGDCRSAAQATAIVSSNVMTAAGGAPRHRQVSSEMVCEGPRTRPLEYGSGRRTARLSSRTGNPAADSSAPPGVASPLSLPSLAYLSLASSGFSRTATPAPAFHLPPFPPLQPLAAGVGAGTRDSGRWSYLRQLRADINGIAEAMGDSKLAAAAAMSRVQSDPGSTGNRPRLPRAASSLSMADGRSVLIGGEAMESARTLSLRNSMGELARLRLSGSRIWSQHRDNKRRLLIG